MKTLTLHRNYFPHGTFSFLCDENGNAILKTVERPWKNNAAGISCVPEGTYDLVPHNSPKFFFSYFACEQRDWHKTPRLQPGTRR